MNFLKKRKKEQRFWVDVWLTSYRRLVCAICCLPHSQMTCQQKLPPLMWWAWAKWIVVKWVVRILLVWCFNSWWHQITTIKTLCFCAPLLTTSFFYHWCYLCRWMCYNHWELKQTEQHTEDFTQQYTSSVLLCQTSGHHQAYGPWFRQG